MTRFSTNKTDLKAYLYLIMLPWQRRIRQLNYTIKMFVLLTCLLPFLLTKGSGVLETRVELWRTGNASCGNTSRLASVFTAFTSPPNLSRVLL